ncbi:HAD-like protein [Heliocybe sulcata]|uniref:HAD-like protein n=1 Tax=Heliocybe sulcata TaxID=5364 RepID=A0A5C3MK20_9AGAM|nr:HAD-like protein [Heliocybe sulcata]
MANPPPESFSSIKAILFDVFGTVVDWESGLTRQLKNHADKVQAKDARIVAKLNQVDWLAFARDWRKAFWAVATAFPRSQDIDDFDIDEVHKGCLQGLIPKYGLEDAWTGAQVDEITKFWHYLEGSFSLRIRISEHYIIAPCANGTLRVLIDMARHADLPWHTIFTSDVLHTFKPSPSFYLRAAHLLRLPPSEILMVAAHDYDLAAASQVGFHTCYVRRTTEDAGGGHVKVGAEGVEWLVDGFAEIVEGLTTVRV